MSDKTSIRKTNKANAKKGSRSQQSISIASLRMRYTFMILLSTLVLAGIAMVMHIETPMVWTFLYGVGGWAALTNNLGKT